VATATFSVVVRNGPGGAASGTTQVTATIPDASGTYGPSAGAQAIRDGTGPDTVSNPGAGQSFATWSELVTKINASAADSIFVASASLYTVTSQATWTAGKHPRIYFLGAPGTVTITGNGADINAISAPDGGCEVHGGTFTGFGNLTSTTRAGIIARSNVLVEDATFTNNLRGIADGATPNPDVVTIRRCLFQDNLWVGMDCGRATTMLCEYNKVQNNNTGGFDAGGSAAGFKILITAGTFRYNWFLDNQSWGLWFDSSTGPHTINDNVCENNVGPGLFYERSGPARIHNNYLTNNGKGAAFGAFQDWQLLARNSDAPGGEIEIDHNDIDDTERVLGVANITEGGMANANIHHNRLWLRAAAARVGGHDAITPELLWTTPITWNNNLYKVASMSASYWQWGANETLNNWAAWQALGFDANGTRELI